MDEYQPPQVIEVEDLNGMLFSCASGDFCPVGPNDGNDGGVIDP